MLGHTTASLRRTRGFCLLNGHVRPVCDFHVRAICHYQTACGITDGQRTASRAFRLFRFCFRSFGLFYTAADGQLGICTLTGIRAVTCAFAAHTDALNIDVILRDIVSSALGHFVDCFRTINSIIPFKGDIHVGIIPCVDARCGIFRQIDFGIIQRQVNIGFFVIIIIFQIHTDINAVAAGGQVGILDCQVNICTFTNGDSGFTCFAGICIHAVNHDFYIVAFGAISLFRLFDIFHNGDGVSSCGLRRGTVLCVVARRICGIVRRCGFRCAIVGVISGWLRFRWLVAVLDVDRTIASFRFILIDVGAVLLTAVLTLITVRAASLILVNSYTAIAQIIRHRRSTGANRAHCNRSGQRHCCQLEFLVCHFLLLLSSSCSHDRKVVVKQQADTLSTVFCIGTRFSQKHFQLYDSTLYEKIKQK